MSLSILLKDMQKIFYTLSLTFPLLLSGCMTTSNTGGGGGISTSSGYEDVDISKIQDPTPIHEPKSKYGNPKTYKVFGKSYYVKESAEGFRERGHASWYGHPFHGRRTSSGETYDMYKMTAAHKTVPIPCYMRVTNLETGKSIIVRVNDRGPFHHGRVIDLSYVAAKKLGVHAKGTVPVEVAVVTPSYDPGPTLASQTRVNAVTVKTPVTTVETTTTQLQGQGHSQTQGQQIFLQVASFANHQRAEQVAKSLQNLPNQPAVHVKSINNSNFPIHRVQIGPFSSSSQALQYTSYVTQLYPDTTPVVVTY